MASITNRSGIAVIGDLVLDIMASDIEEPLGSVRFASAGSIIILHGGSAHNTVFNIAKLNEAFKSNKLAKPKFFGPIGNCKNAKFLKNEMEKLKDIIEYNLSEYDEQTTTAIMMNTNDGKKSCILTTGCQNLFKPESLDLGEILSSKHVHIGGYFCLKPFQNGEFVEMLKKIENKGITISMDCQSDCEKTDGSIRWVGKNYNLFEVMNHLDVFMPSRLEAFGISEQIKNLLKNDPEKIENFIITKRTGHLQKDPVLSVDNEKLEEAFKNIGMFMKTNSVLIIKCDEDGAYWNSNFEQVDNQDGKVKFTQVATEKVTVVDDLGAGDSFNAGFIFKMETLDGFSKLKGMKKNLLEEDFEGFKKIVEESIGFGCIMGEKCVQVKGACPEGIAMQAIQAERERNKNSDVYLMY